MTEESTPSTALEVWDLKGKLLYELALPMETPSLNVIKGMHFHAYKNLRRSWRQMVLAAVGGEKPETPVQRAFLVVTRECAGGGLDWDNAYGGLKPLLDCLVAPSNKNPDGLGLIADDNPRNMPYPPFVRQKSAKPGQGRTTLQIFEIVD
jgi:hypothetical protein